MRIWLSLSSDLLLGLVIGGVLLTGVLRWSAPPARAQGGEAALPGAVSVAVKR